MTAAPDLYSRLLRPFNEAGIPYMVTGGLAAIVYGEPRLTNDVDVVLQLRPVDAGRLTAAFPASSYYVPPVETIREEAARPAHGHFNILDLDTALRADIYCAGDDPLAAWGLPRRRAIQLGEGQVWIAPIEYVIVLKLRYFRESHSDRHLRDIAAMRRLSGELIDQRALQDWIGRLGLESEWQMALEAT